MTDLDSLKSDAVRKASQYRNLADMAKGAGNHTLALDMYAETVYWDNVASNIQRLIRGNDVVKKNDMLAVAADDDDDEGAEESDVLRRAKLMLRIAKNKRKRAKSEELLADVMELLDSIGKAEKDE